MADRAEEYAADEITCPYCGDELGDSWECPDEGEIECGACGKKFIYTRDTSVSYQCMGDCILNGEEHDYEWVDTSNGGAYFCNKCPEIKLKGKKGHENEKEKCPECGGNCSPECGLHPKGCIYGGLSKGYWLVVEGCTLSHGEADEYN